MNEFEKPKTTRFLKKFLSILIAGLMIAGSFAYIYSLSNISNPSIDPSSFEARPASFVQSPVWSGNGNYAIFDHHTHTNISDGVLSQKAVVDLAVNSQCDVLALTDHSDIAAVTTPRHFDEIDALRSANPNLIIFSGLEINIPSYDGREHLTLLADPAQERQTLTSLKIIAEADNEDTEIKDPTREVDQKFFNRVNLFNQTGANLVVLYNHPSRMDVTPGENKNDMIAWNRYSPSFIGFAGAPGHQNSEPHGLYEESIKTVNRWDHIAANVGDVWDQLLGEGYQLWGALAGSDFHDKLYDFAPCSFSRTHLELEDRSHEGVLKALRAGTFWADHGRILNRLVFSANMDGLERPAYPGSIVQTGTSKKIDIKIDINRGSGSFGKPLVVEIVSNCRSGRAAVVGSKTLLENELNAEFTIDAIARGPDNSSCYARSVVRLVDAQDELLAMTNPIRFRL